jgi:hypothetical protein
MNVFFDPRLGAYVDTSHSTAPLCEIHQAPGDDRHDPRSVAFPSEEIPSAKESNSSYSSPFHTNGRPNDHTRPSKQTRGKIRVEKPPIQEKTSRKSEMNKILARDARTEYRRAFNQLWETLPKEVRRAERGGDRPKLRLMRGYVTWLQDRNAALEERVRNLENVAATGGVCSGSQDHSICHREYVPHMW